MVKKSENLKKIPKNIIKKKKKKKNLIFVRKKKLQKK